MEASEQHATNGETAVAEAMLPDEQRFGLAAMQVGAGFELRPVRKPGDILKDAVDAAQQLRDMIEKTGSVQRYGDHEHLKYEAWQLLGAFFGLTSRAVGEPHFVEYLDAHGFKAVCEAVHGPTGKVMARATGHCLTDEPLWLERPKYAYQPDGKGDFRKVLNGTEPVSHQARSSMAQTRAGSKCLAMCLRWVAVLGGYSPTPAEEMGEPPLRPQPPAAPRATEPKGRAGGGKSRGKIINASQAARLWAIFKGSGIPRARLGVILRCNKGATSQQIYLASKQVPVADYDAVVAAIEQEGTS